MKKCPNCSANVSDSAKFCNHCGFNIKKSEEDKNQGVKVCPQCGTKFSCGHFCPECGYDINKISDDFKIKNGVLIKYKGNSSHVIVPNGVYAIGNTAFYSNNNIQKVTFPTGVRLIGQDAFCGCNNLTIINLPEGLESISNRAFFRCDLHTITIPKSVVAISNTAFIDNYLTKIKAPRHLAEQLIKYKNILKLY